MSSNLSLCFSAHKCGTRRPRLAAFIESSTRNAGVFSSGTQTRSHRQPYQFVIADDDDTESFDISELIIGNIPQETRFVLASWNNSLPNIIDRMNPTETEPQTEPQRQLVFNIKDKMSIFISICSLLLSLQFIQPRLML